MEGEAVRADDWIKQHNNRAREENERNVRDRSRDVCAADASAARQEAGLLRCFWGWYGNEFDSAARFPEQFVQLGKSRTATGCFLRSYILTSRRATELSRKNRPVAVAVASVGEERKCTKRAHITRTSEVPTQRRRLCFCLISHNQNSAQAFGGEIRKYFDFRLIVSKNSGIRIYNDPRSLAFHNNHAYTVCKA